MEISTLLVILTVTKIMFLMLKNRQIKIETIMLFFMTDNGISKISKGAKQKQDVLKKRFLKTFTTIKAMESSDWEESWVYCTTCIWKAPVTLLSWAVVEQLSSLVELLLHCLATQLLDNSLLATHTFARLFNESRRLSSIFRWCCFPQL